MALDINHAGILAQVRIWMELPHLKSVVSRSKPFGQMLIISVVAVFATASFAHKAIGYNSEEHKISADIGASQVQIPAGVVLPAGVQFSTKDAGEYLRQFQNAKMLSVGFASNNEGDYDKNREKVQDNYYYYTFGQSNFNLKQWIPPFSLAPSRVLYVPTILRSTAEPFSFGELVSFYGDYRRTVVPSPSGACYLSDIDLPLTIHFKRGNTDPRFAPTPLPSGNYLRRIASGLVPPFGKKGNATGYTANPGEYDEAGWWGDEMMRVAAINDWHFSNIAIAWYVGLHRLALVHVNKARSNPQHWIAALHYEACALHSLTDLFCLGHLVVNRDKSSFAINKSSGVLNGPTVGWMNHVLAMGGGTRGQTGLLHLESGLPPINDITAPRDNSLNWDPKLMDGLAAGNENKYHDKFNASGAIVRNLNGDEFQIYGDFKMKVTPDQTRALIIRTVRESLQALFDSYARMQSGEAPAVIGAPGSSFFRALRYIPVWIENDPDDFFPGKWTLFAKYADDIAGTKKVPREWYQCRIPWIDGYGDLPPRATRRGLQIISAKVTSSNSGTSTPYSLAVEYVISGMSDNEKSLVEETAFVTGPEKMKPITTERTVTKADGRITKVWTFNPSKSGNYTFHYELGFKCGIKTGKCPFDVGAESGDWKLKATSVQYGVHTDQPAGVGALAPVYKVPALSDKLIFQNLGPIGKVYRPVPGIEIGPDYIQCKGGYNDKDLRVALQWTGVPQRFTSGNKVLPWVKLIEFPSTTLPNIKAQWMVPGQLVVNEANPFLDTYMLSLSNNRAPGPKEGKGFFWPWVERGPLLHDQLLTDRIILQLRCHQAGNPQSEYFRIVWHYDRGGSSSKVFTADSAEDRLNPASSTVTAGDAVPPTAGGQSRASSPSPAGGWPAMSSSPSARISTNTMPPVSKTRDTQELEGIWERADKHRVRFVKQGETTYFGYIETLTPGLTSCGFRVNEMTLKVRRISKNQYTGLILWKWVSGATEWREVTITVADNRMTDSSTGSWIRVGSLP